VSRAGCRENAARRAPRPLRSRSRSLVTARGSGSPGRVARGSCLPPALTEPDLWTSHPALRDAGVGELNPLLRRRRYRPQLSKLSVSCPWAMMNRGCPRFVITGKPGSHAFSDFGTAYWAMARAGALAGPGTAPRGLSAVSRTVAAGLPLRWPWSLSLPPHLAGLGPPFDGLPVQCNHPTSLVSSPSRYGFLDDYRRWRKPRDLPR